MFVFSLKSLLLSGQVARAGIAQLYSRRIQLPTDDDVTLLRWTYFLVVRH